MFSVVPDICRFSDKITTGKRKGKRTENRVPCASISKLEEYSGICIQLIGCAKNSSYPIEP